MTNYLLAIDQGTSSSRAIVFDTHGRRIALAQREFRQYYPADGWVEHDAQEILESSLAVCREAIAQTPGGVNAIAGIGITNQRETTVVWDRQSGKPVYQAIVWQDRRTADYCAELKTRGLEPQFTERTGLLLDPYFSATKLRWILENVDGVRERAEAGELAFGTVDSWLLWHLTGGKHATDATNASRTLMFDVRRQCWDGDALEIFGIPAQMLPEVLDSAADFGSSREDIFGRSLPVAGIAGDQQAALLGQACINNGDIKATYGTGCFLMQNTGDTLLQSKSKLLGTVAWRLNGRTTYAVEGSIFMAGASVQWLRDEMGLIGNAAESEPLAASVPSTGGVYLVPGFTGLGAPHWRPDVRGALMGMTRNSNRAHIVRATLESVVYQTQDLIAALLRDGAPAPEVLRVDGGMMVNNWLMQFMADQLLLPVERPQNTENSAWGAACLAGLQLGLFNSLEEIAASWESDARCLPQQAPSQADARYSGWQEALSAVLGGSGE